MALETDLHRRKMHHQLPITYVSSEPYVGHLGLGGVGEHTIDFSYAMMMLPFRGVVVPQIPPRNAAWAKKGKWVRLAKVAFEKYFMRKMKTGNSEPLYEKYVLKALGIKRLS
ncbi:hypothetical protein [Hydrogenophaga sp. 70-12]|uniref:hypothetical protein n=1 Tax=Hydrogenophaga sp. 70-12 TaxID=1895769 RepID=UPI00095D9C9D|nr:MAG: hypothetical protein BGO22_11655 [Hydrogenophaga sp. 70-12]